MSDIFVQESGMIDVFTVEQEPIDIFSVSQTPIDVFTVGAQGPAGVVIEESVVEELIGLEWGVPVIAPGRIEVVASAKTFLGDPFLSALICVELLVSDAPNIYEPSDTSVFAQAIVPTGTLLAGPGTGRSVWMTDLNGNFKVAVLDPGIGSRYIWTKGGGHEQKTVRATTGILQVTFV